MATTAQIHGTGIARALTLEQSSRKCLRKTVSIATASFDFPELKSGRRGYGVGSVRSAVEKAVGIDLGTTNSAVAVVEGSEPNMIANSDGQRTTPSVAYTTAGEILIGEIAKRQCAVNSENTFFSVKRFVGQKMNEINEKAKQVSYTAVEDENGNVKVQCPAMGKQFAAREISAKVN